MTADPDLDAAPSRRLAPAAAYALALGMVAAATAVALGVEQVTPIPNLSMVFVLPVVIAAVAFGLRPALAAAAGGVLAFNYFLLAPRYSLRIDEPANVWAMILLAAVALIASGVAAEARRRTMQARAAARRAQTLQGLARRLVAAPDVDAVATACAEALSVLFAAPAMVLVEADGALEVRARAGGAEPAANDLAAAEWALASRLPARGGVYPHPDSAFDVWPVLSAQRQGAVLGLAISGREEGRPGNPEELTEVVGAYLAVALDRQAYAAQVIDARVEAAGERLKADLLAAVSHDLKTPLSTVLFTLQSLGRFKHGANERAELLALAETETVRLAKLVDDLLDSNRLDAGAIAVRPAAADPHELVADAVAQAAGALAGHVVVREVPAGAPALLVDPGLFGNALAKVLENAGRHTPSGGTVRILAGAEAGEGWIEVRDEGPGLPAPAERLFEKFVRGAAGDGRPPGLGLGLPLARGFLAAMGGRITAGDREDGPGAWVRLSAPLAAQAQAA